MEAEKKLELEEVVPYSEQEKTEALEKYKINAAQSKNFCEWRGYCMWTFSRKYSSEVLCTIIYQTCDGDYRRYISSIDEKCTKDGNVEGEKQAKEFALKKEVMRSFLKEDNIPLYCKILMEYGNMCNNVLANNMGDFFKSLQSIELSMEKKDVLGKEEYTEDYMIDKWESIIYYILVGEGVMPYAVLKQVEEDNIEKKNLKSENYTVEDIKRICHSYNMENQNQGKDIMLTEKFPPVRLENRTM